MNKYDKRHSYNELSYSRHLSNCTPLIHTPRHQMSQFIVRVCSSLYFCLWQRTLFIVLPNYWPKKKNHWIKFYHLVIKETHCLNNKSPKWHDISCLSSWIKKEIFTLIVVEKEEELRFKRPVPKFFHQRRFCQRKYARNFVNEHEKTQVATLGFLKWKSPKLFNSITKYKSLRHCVLSCKRNNWKNCLFHRD